MAFTYDETGHLMIDGIAADELASTYGTPLYVYSAAGFLAHLQAFQQAVSNVNGKVHFAVKAKKTSVN